VIVSLVMTQPNVTPLALPVAFREGIQTVKIKKLTQMRNFFLYFFLNSIY
jgi:hypothetical protein